MDYFFKKKCFIHIKTCQSLLVKVEIFLEKREVAFISPIKICENLNSRTEIKIFIFCWVIRTQPLCSKIISTLARIFRNFDDYPDSHESHADGASRKLSSCQELVFLNFNLSLDKQKSFVPKKVKRISLVLDKMRAF